MAVTVDGRGRSTPQSRRNFRDAMVFLSPWLVGMLGLWLIPTGLSLYFAFTDYTGTVWPPHLDRLQRILPPCSTAPIPIFLTTVTCHALVGVVQRSHRARRGLGLAMLLNLKVRGIAFYRTISSCPPWCLSWAARCCSSGFSIRSMAWSITCCGSCICRSPAGLPIRPGRRPALVLQNIWGAGATMIIFLAGLQDCAARTPRGGRDGRRRSPAPFLARHPAVLTPTIFFNLVLGMINSFQYFAQAFVASTSPAPGRRG